MSNKIKFLAYYLPQYHQIPENDEWWGEGFTEWTNVKKAKPLFKGHKQPVLPGELGYYDLLKTEGIQEKQASLAKEYGIDGFIYYQYWFGSGKMLLEKPAEKMLANKKVDLPFCFCWANETWSGIWHGLTDKILAEQTYPGEEDEQRHFAYLLPFFNDDRYIKIEGKPLFIIYDALAITDIVGYIKRIRARAKIAGLPGLYLVASNRNPDEGYDYSELGLDGKISFGFNTIFENARKDKNRLEILKKRILGRLGITYLPLLKFRANHFFKDLYFRNLNVDTFPVVVPNWDNSARSGNRAIIITHNNQNIFEKQLEKAVTFLKESKNKQNFIIVKSWNEWAEGNYLEPDAFSEYQFLKKIKEINKNV